jgi:AcrR family transcriptional regulator
VGELDVKADRLGRRKHSTGEATRVSLMEAAERLFAVQGIEAVPLREIQLAAGQSNTSVIGYHFTSREGLVRALIEYRHAGIDSDREAMIARMHREGTQADARAVVWLIVRPLVNSIARGEMFAPFLARLAETPHARSLYWPEHIDDVWSSDQMEQLVAAALQDLPERVRRGRTFQLYNSVLNLMGDRARTGRAISEPQLHNYVDGWVGLLTAPVSYETRALLED